MEGRKIQYDDWIIHQREFRLKLLMDSTEIRQTNIYRICRDCGEICLCREVLCPNCGSAEIDQTRIHDVEKEVISCKRIRCRKRYEGI